MVKQISAYFFPPSSVLLSPFKPNQSKVQRKWIDIIEIFICNYLINLISEQLT